MFEMISRFIQLLLGIPKAIEITRNLKKFKMRFTSSLYDFFIKFSEKTIKVNLYIQNATVILYLLIYSVTTIISIFSRGENKDKSFMETLFQGGEMGLENALFSAFGQLAFVIGSAYFGHHSLKKSNVLELNMFILMSTVSVFQCISGVWACNKGGEMSICDVNPN